MFLQDEVIQLTYEQLLSVAETCTFIHIDRLLDGLIDWIQFGSESADPLTITDEMKASIATYVRMLFQPVKDETKTE